MHTYNLKPILVSQDNWRSSLPFWSFNLSVCNNLILFCTYHSFFKLINCFESGKLLNLWKRSSVPIICWISTYSNLKGFIIFIIVHGVRIISLVKEFIENCLIFIILLEQILFIDVFISILDIKVAKYSIVF